MTSGSQVYAAQDTTALEVHVTSPSSRTLSGGEEKQLRKKLELAKDVAIKVVTVGQATPLVINEASVRGAERERQAVGAEPMINDHAMSARIVVTNTIQRDVTGLGLHFTSKETSFYVYYRSISLKAGKSGLILIKFMCVSGEPSRLVVQLAGAELSGGRVWGEFPVPSGSTASPIVSPESEDRGAIGPKPSSAGAGDLGQRPVLLNAPQPRYTERARQNKVMGSAFLRVMVGEDGHVKQAKVIRSLPDFLTEEAIRAAFEMKFKPAIKDGQAVPYWLPMLVEFNLK
jgi:TonB family protein